MRCVRKGQAAMEFLMTYGWALVVVLVTLSALAFFGVLTPSGVLPETCFLGPGFACDDFKINETGVYMSVINALGKDLDEFIIVVNKEAPLSSELCGGRIGFARMSIDSGAGIESYPFDGLEPGVNPGPFKDGQTRPIYTLRNVANPNPNHVQFMGCKGDFFTVQPAVCSNFIDTGNAGGSFNPYGYVLSPPGIAPPTVVNGNVCTEDNEDGLEGQQGNSLDLDFAIIYRAVGSTIYHRRQGSLAVTVE